MKDLLSASILSADFSHLADAIQECETAGADWIHIDVMDGHFVPNLTMGPFIVKTCREITKLPLDCHLMIDNPEILIDAFFEAGASIITLHPENNPKVFETIQRINSFGCKTGIAINPSTPIDYVKNLIPYVDLLLIMTVHPGYSGQKLIPSMIQKIEKARELSKHFKNLKYIQVDGGINYENIQNLKIAGANVFVAATSIFNYPDGITAGVHKLRDRIS
jgi:ribulose-phosphate 3-epimerase